MKELAMLIIEAESVPFDRHERKVLLNQFHLKLQKLIKSCNLREEIIKEFVLKEIAFTKLKLEKEFNGKKEKAFR